MLKEKYREMVEDGENFDSKYRDWPLFFILLLGLITPLKPTVLADTYPHFYEVLESNIILLLYALTGFTLSRFQSMQSLPIRRRILFLGIAAMLGIISLSSFDIKDIEYIPKYITEYITEYITGYLLYLILVLPTFYTLWVFRTHDVQRQIDKTQENINNSSFFECARMLTADDSSSTALAKHQHVAVLEQLAYLKRETGFRKRKTADSSSTASAKHQYIVALEQLAYLRRETEFDKKRIDLLTRNLVLKNKDLKFTQLSGINLLGADLEEAHLTGAYLEMAQLTVANLQGVDFVSANLRNADLEYSDLRNADLRDATLEGTKFKGAKYNAKTKKNFPEGFTPEGKGMVYDSDPPQKTKPQQR